MKRLLLVVSVAAVLWSAWWGLRAWQADAATQSWFDARRAEGWEASYSDLTLRGFPNRIDRTFSDLILADPQARAVWEAPFFQLFQLTYKPGHTIAIWPETHDLTLGSTRWQIRNDGMRASFVRDGDHVLRSNLEAAVLNLTSDNGRAMALADVRAAFLQQGEDPQTYRVALTAGAVAGNGGVLADSSLAQTVNALQTDMIVEFDRPVVLDSLTADRPQPTRLDIRLAEYRYGDLELKVTGTLDISPRGLPEGRLTLRAQNWRALLAAAVDTGQLPAALADTLAQGLSLIAGLSGTPGTIDVPLDFAGGQTRLGPIPLGPAPILRLP